MSDHRGFDDGLRALHDISDAGASSPAGGTASPAASASVEMPVDDLEPGRYQPRRNLSEERLAELTDSVRAQGVLQPLLVRAVGPDAGESGTASRFEIVAGERRWRAARLAGLATVPVIVRALDDQAALAVALIENLQREDLNPIDQAQSLSRLATEFALTHEQVAKAVGRSRASVTNHVRLLELQDEVKDLLMQGELEMGHARALLTLGPEPQVAMARKATRRGWSVRQVEKAVRTLHEVPVGPAGKPNLELQTRWLQTQLARELEQKLSIRRNRDGTYSLQLGFDDLAQLEERLQRIQELVRRVRDAAGPRARDVNGSG